MIKVLRVFNKMICNQAFVFVLGKYFAYGLQFLNAILIAKFLGPYYFGIYGFIFLIIKYLNFVNTGVHYAVNVELSIHDRKNIDEANSISSNGLYISILTSVLLLCVALILYFLEVEIFSKYHFRQYLLPTTFIGITIIFNLFFTNVCRSYAKFNQILYYLILPQLFQLGVLFVAKGEQRVDYLIFGFMGGNLIAVFIFLFNYPLKIKLNFEPKVQKKLLQKGFSLVFYNASFYFIIISARTIVSIYYDVESLGIFSFAYSVAQAAILILGVIGFVFFPKLLYKLKPDIPLDEAKALLLIVKKNYTTASYLLVFTVIVIYSILMLFMDSYKTSEIIFLFLIVIQLLISKVFGYSNVLVARGYEVKIAFYAFITMLINIALDLFGIYFFSMQLNGIAICVFLSIIFYTFAVARTGKIILNENFTGIQLVRELFPVNFLIPLLILILERIFIGLFYSSIFPLLIFIILNYKSILSTIVKFIKVFSNVDSVKF